MTDSGPPVGLGNGEALVAGRPGLRHARHRRVGRGSAQRDVLLGRRAERDILLRRRPERNVLLRWAAQGNILQRRTAQRDLLLRRSAQGNLLQGATEDNQLRRRRGRRRLLRPLLRLQERDELGILIHDLREELYDLGVALIAAAVAEQTGLLDGES